MKQWNPDNAKDLNLSSLKLAPLARRWLPFQKLHALDLLIVLQNSQWRPYRGSHFLFSFRQAALTPGYAIGQSAGLEDVSILMNERGWVVTVTRNWTWPQITWSTSFALMTQAESLLLTQHASDRLRQRGLSGDDVVFAIRHGNREHRNNQVHYELLGCPRRVPNGTRWQRLNGVHVVVCPFTTEIITVWQNFRQVHRQLQSTTDASSYRESVSLPKHGPRSWWGWNLF